MADIDNENGEGLESDIEKQWEKQRGKLTRKMKKVDGDSVGVYQQARQTEFRDKKRDEILSDHRGAAEKENITNIKLPNSSMESSPPPTLASGNPSFINPSSPLERGNQSPPSLSNESPPFRRLSEGRDLQLPEGEEEDLGPERDSFTLLKGISSGTILAGEVTAGERRVVVDTLKKQGRTQDDIAALLGVSRRTIVSDYRWLKEKAVDAVRKLDAYDLAADVYSLGWAAVASAMRDGKARSAAQIMKDVTEMLQSLGVVFRAPATSKIASIVGHVGLHQGYSRYSEQVGPEKEKVVAILGKMMSALSEEQQE